MKKITYYIASALVTLGAFASCDIDDVKNYTEKSTENFPVNENDATAILAGIYESLNEQFSYTQQSWLLYADLASDDQYGGGGVNDKLFQSHDLLSNYNADATA